MTELEALRKEVDELRAEVVRLHRAVFPMSYPQPPQIWPGYPTLPTCNPPYAWPVTASRASDFATYGQTQIVNSTGAAR